MNKLNKILLILVVVLVVILGVVLYWKNGGFEKPYYAVYLSTGEIYFGKLSRFPQFSLSNVWILQRSGDNQNPYGITKFDKAFWGPEDELNIDQKNVVWTAKLKDDSQLVQLFKNPELAQQQNQQQLQQQIQNSTSTKK